MNQFIDFPSNYCLFSSLYEMEELFPCKFCDYKATRKYNLPVHIQAKHESKKKEQQEDMINLFVKDRN